MRQQIFVCFLAAAVSFATADSLAAEPRSCSCKAKESDLKVCDENGENCKKLLCFESDDCRHSLQLGARVQFRYTQEDPEEGDSEGSFRTRRARVSLSGQVFEHWKYKIQVALEGSSSDDLLDAYFQYSKHTAAQFWLGQGKAFFGRQQLTSSGSQQFVDRSITSGRFAHGRDQGVALVGKKKDKTLEYNLGLYNGNGINGSDDNSEKMIVGRVVWTPQGEYKLAESALDTPDEGRWALGASFLSNTEGDGVDAVDITRFGLEVAYKIHGFSAVGEYYTEEADRDAFGQEDTDGYYLQLGYLIPNTRFEVALRYATIEPDLPVAADRIETGIAVSYYFEKHKYKVQADFRNLEDEFTDTDDREIRVQIQLSF